MSGPEPAHDPLADALTAARLFALDPHGLGGLWLRGAGPVRDALVDQLKAGLPDNMPLRRMPATIDDGRLLGALNISASLGAGRAVLQKGLLAEADGGVVIAPMAERLPEAIAGRIGQVLDWHAVQVERDGVAGTMQAAIGLVLLDDGCGEEERPPSALTERVAFHCDLTGIASLDFPQVRRKTAIGPAQVAEPDADALRALAGTATALGVGSARALLFAVRAARASAALDARKTVEEEDIIVAARLVLAPRATRIPAVDAPEQAEQETPREPQESEAHDQDAGEDLPSLEDMVLAAAAASVPPDILNRIGDGVQRGASRGGGAGKRRKSQLRGRPLAARPGMPGGGSRLALIDTLRAAAPWQTLRREEEGENAPRRIRIRRPDLRIRRFEERSGTVTIFAVDASGSSALARLAEAKGAIELMLAQAYVKRAQVALIAFRGEGAELLLPPTRSLTRARRALAELPGGGGTPLAAGLDMAGALGALVETRGRTPFLVTLTDGKANVGRDGKPGRKQAREDSEAAAKRIAVTGMAGVVVDISPRAQPEATELAAALRMDYLPLPRADAAALHGAVDALQDRAVPA
ncbi:magnesium chelatase subunit D [Parasphingopyxis algicola]|uniref:magnesium chelatase subunit D n=1 Tax=Parasphingopyxis algicola TaxID=2026624 RepID=UPI0015A06EB5|nr:magnesium chelatase subunit D [Parasphingopyxis algicola]QLC24798.1 magnesium chelatase subunit D [Parasphingopyxis algicola]